MPGDINTPVGGGGPGSVQYTGPVLGLGGVGIGPQVGPSDTLEVGTGENKKGVANVYSPELMEALFMMWFTGGASPVFLQQVSSKGNTFSVGAVGEADAANESKPIDADLFLLQVENQLNEICIKVLDAWAKSIHEEAEALKKELKSDLYKEWLARHGSAGYEAWVRTLSPEQRLQIVNYPHIEPLANIDRGISHGLHDYLVEIKTNTDPTVSQDLPFITAALVVGGTLRYEYVGMVDTVSTSQILIQPVKNGNDQILASVGPQDQAMILGYIGALFLSGASYYSLGHTVPVGNSSKAEIDLHFAKNYAQKVLDVINGSAFNTVALAMITSSIDPNGQLSDERVSELVKYVKIALLSTALALLYRTETTVQGQGGGITGQEFIAMARGNPELLDSELKQQIGHQLQVLLAEVPESDAILASIGTFVDEHKTARSLIDVGSLLAVITLDKGPNPTVIGA